MKKLLKIAISILLIMSCLSACGKNKVYKYTKCSICEKEKNCYEILITGTLGGDYLTETGYVCSDICEKEAKTRSKIHGFTTFEVVYK